MTSLCSTMTLGSLTKAQVAQLCTETIRYFASQLDAGTWCHWEGLKKAASSSPMSNSDVQKQCGDNSTNCEQSDAGSDAGFPTYINWELQMMGTNVANCFGGPIDPSCMGTVAQYSTCITQETTALISEVNLFPACAMLQLTDVDKVMQAQSQAFANPPAGCMTIENMCSGLTPPDPSQL